MRLFPCRQSGCSAYVEKRGGHCARHKSDNDRTRDTVRQMYEHKRWDGKYGVRNAVLNRNPICQRLHAERGRLVQCHNPSTLVHHRHSPRVKPELFLAVYDDKGESNLIALCASCHPSDAGTPSWVEGRDFVRTEFNVKVA